MQVGHYLGDFPLIALVKPGKPAIRPDQSRHKIMRDLTGFRPVAESEVSCDLLDFIRRPRGEFPSPEIHRMHVTTRILP